MQWTQTSKWKHSRNVGKQLWMLVIFPRKTVARRITMTTDNDDNGDSADFMDHESGSETSRGGQDDGEAMGTDDDNDNRNIMFNGVSQLWQ